jgi:cell wall-associated NlpC family hydrolase
MGTQRAPRPRTPVVASPPMRRARPSRRPLALVIGLAVMVGVASPAAAALSRQEAYRMALKGKSTPQILKRAFPGVSFSRTPEAPIRVLLVDEAPQIVVSGQSDLALTDAAADTTFAAATLLAGHRYQVTRTGTDYIVADLEAATKFRLKGPVVIDSQGAETGIRLAEPAVINRRYRGQLVLYDGRQSTISVNNVVDVESYLLGTLPGDMPSRWGSTKKGAAALRAGAVALRSRALTQRKLPTAPFDFTADDPRYLGLDGERTFTTAAVTKTKRLTMRRNGFAYPASFGGSPAMGSNAFQPRQGRPIMVALGPAKQVEGSGSGKAQKALQRALSFQGVPYLWGGTSPSGFDCSGLTYYVFAEQGVKLPRVAADQARVGQPIARVEELLPGDAVFFADSSGYIHHMGLYIGGPNQEFVHAPSTGDVVKISSIKNSSYYTRQFAGGRRFA